MNKVDILYNFQEVVNLSKDDLIKLYNKAHPLQVLIAEKFNVRNKSDYFSLPQPYMLAMDKAELVYTKGSGKYGKGFATASLNIQPEDPWFWCHFLGDPVMPGSQGLDAFIQLAGTWGAFSGEVFGRARALEGSFTFTDQILPGCKKIYYRVDIKRFLKKKRVLFFDGSLSVDRPQNVIYQFGINKIGYFTREELSIQENNVIEYYQPDWEKARRNAISWIENAEKYYKGGQNK